MIATRKTNGRRPVSPDPAPSAAGPPVSPVGPRRLHDPVTAQHEAIDFARALVADGGQQTAGLTMLRGEIGHLQREVHAWRQELAAVRVELDGLRAEMLRASSWTRGTLVPRIGQKFAEVDGRLAALGVAGCPPSPAGNVGR